MLRSASGSITLEPAVGDDGTFPRERLVLILSAFECSIYSAQSYQDSDGARIYLSEFGRIRLAPDGRVTFSADGGGIPVSTVAGSLSGSASANEARACSALISACCGSDAALRFCPISFGAGASDTVSYGLLADGLPVIREGGARAFAVFTFSGGALVFADMYVLTCSAQKGESLPELTPELLAEGRAREIVRAIQDRRKELNCDYVDRIVVALVTDSEDVRAAATEHADYVQGETLAVELGFAPLDGAEPAEIKIDGEKVAVYVVVKA